MLIFGPIFYEEKMTDISKPKLWTGDYLKVWIGNFLMYFAFYLVTPLLPLYLRDVFAADKATIGASGGAKGDAHIQGNIRIPGLFYCPNGG